MGGQPSILVSSTIHLPGRLLLSDIGHGLMKIKVKALLLLTALLSDSVADYIPLIVCLQHRPVYSLSPNSVSGGFIMNLLLVELSLRLS